MGRRLFYTQRLSTSTFYCNEENNINIGITAALHRPLETQRTNAIVAMNEGRNVNFYKSAPDNNSYIDPAFKQATVEFGMYGGAIIPDETDNLIIPDACGNKHLGGKGFDFHINSGKFVWTASEDDLERNMRAMQDSVKNGGIDIGNYCIFAFLCPYAIARKEEEPVYTISGFYDPLDFIGYLRLSSNVSEVIQTPGCLFPNYIMNFGTTLRNPITVEPKDMSFEDKSKARLRNKYTCLGKVRKSVGLNRFIYTQCAHVHGTEQGRGLREKEQSIEPVSYHRL